MGLFPRFGEPTFYYHFLTTKMWFQIIYLFITVYLTLNKEGKMTAICLPTVMDAVMLPATDDRDLG